MISISRQIMFWSRLFNVKGDEWPKIVFSWLLRFFYRVGFVLVWTLLLAQFVYNYGIASLPYLFAFTAFFTMIGSVLFSTLVDRISVKMMLVANTLLAALTVSLVPIFFVGADPLFIGLMLMAVVLFLNQFKLALSGHLEELFTPLQSERIFPLIEAADTMGGIFAGVIITLFVSKIEMLGLLQLASLCFLAIVPILLMFSFRGFDEAKEAKLRVGRKKVYKIGILNRVKSELRDRSYIKFLKGLLALVFLQWFLFNVLEYQYTKAVYTHTSAMAIDFGSGFEHAFVHDLGLMFTLFSSLALLFQLFIAGRMISGLGIFGSSVVHGIVSLFSFIAMTFNFNFAVSVFAKTNFTTTSILHNNAYHSSYYAVKEDSRALVREFLEGIVRPAGAILGTLFVLGFQSIFTNESIDFALNMLMIFAALLLFFVSLGEQHHYTNVAVSTVKESPNLHEKIVALEILSQRGHRKGYKILKTIISDTSLDINVRVLAVNSLSNLETRKSLTVLFDVLEDPDIRVKLPAVVVLSKIDTFKMRELSFSKRYRFLNLLNTFYQSSEISTEIDIMLLEILRHFPDSLSINILLDAIKSDKLTIRLAAISTLGYYNDKNINLKLSKFLKSTNLDEAVSASIALYKSSESHSISKNFISSLLDSNDQHKLSLGVYACGELKLSGKRSFILNLLNSNDLNVKLHSAIALAKFGSRDGVHLILGSIMSNNLKLSKRILKLVDKVDVAVKIYLKKLLKSMVVSEIESILSKSKTVPFSDVDHERLKYLYHILGYSDEVLL